MIAGAMLGEFFNALQARPVPKVGRPDTRTIPEDWNRARSWPPAYLWHPDGRTLWPVNTLQLQFLISILAGWVNRGQQDIIEYLQEED